ncbi:cycloheximide resistance protein [Niveomyces insectorum RCEF 264]|uniref:Cycloheximide resistance protein n=1 Tax=Niveomyces insectorum RCEF 264 TaxID=1081102 RepID=A0A167YZV5_9HYPO|nr:cycloheximide resistance protein [Niveomyces insectorum RCEF 264]
MEGSFRTAAGKLTYGVYYSFFESFPLVYQDQYGFNLEQLGLCFLATLVGLSVAVTLLCAYFYFISPKQLAQYHSIPPEARIWPGLFATFLIPMGLFLFGACPTRALLIEVQKNVC